MQAGIANRTLQRTSYNTRYLHTDKYFREYLTRTRYNRTCIILVVDSQLRYILRYSIDQLRNSK